MTPKKGGLVSINAASAQHAELVPLSRLSPAPWNPRLIQDERFKNLCRSIEADPDFLWQRPILATTDGAIFAGNMRYRAVSHLGWPDVPAVLADIPEQLARERALRDNAQWGEWEDQALAEMLYGLQQEGSALDLLGFEDDEITRLLESVGGMGDTPTGDDPGPALDRAAELQEKWSTSRGQLWEIGRHRLLCGDSTSAEDVSRLMGGERVGAVVTDPPYGMNLDTDYSSMPKTTRTYAPVTGDDHPFDARMLRVVSVGVAEQFWFGADYYARVLGDTEHEGSWLVWDKRVTENYDAGFGSAFELIWSAKPRRREILRHQWFQNHAEAAAEGADRHHPTQKPVALISDLIERSTESGQIVADYFLGSGTTMVAAEQTGRICYGMEIEPKYVAVALERLSGMGLSPRLVDG